MKITEKIIKQDILEANRTVMMSWPYGLKVEPSGSGYILSILWRKPQKNVRQTPIHTEPLPARECWMLFQGFIAAIKVSTPYLQTFVADVGIATPAKREVRSAPAGNVTVDLF